MEVEISGITGIPQDAIISIRAGSSRRQAPVSALGSNGMPFKFAAGAAGCNPFKIDILQPMGSARMALQPDGGTYTVPIQNSSTPGISVQMTVREGKASPGGKKDVAQELFDRLDTNKDGLIGRREFAEAVRQGQGGKPVLQPMDDGSEITVSPGGVKLPPIPKDEDGRFPAAANAAKEYLEIHRLLPFVRALLQTVVRDRPDEPYNFIADQFRNAVPTEPKEATRRPQPQEAVSLEAQERLSGDFRPLSPQLLGRLHEPFPEQRPDKQVPLALLENSADEALQGFSFKPSCGTWLMRSPSQPQSPVQNKAPPALPKDAVEEALQVGEGFNFKPSCGTWLMSPPSQPQSPVQKDSSMKKKVANALTEASLSGSLLGMLPRDDEAPAAPCWASWRRLWVPAPPAPAAPALPAAPSQAEVSEDFNFKPSCGTWLMRPPSQPQSPVKKDIGLLQELDSEAAVVVASLQEEMAKIVQEMTNLRLQLQQRDEEMAKMRRQLEQRDDLNGELKALSGTVSEGFNFKPSCGTWLMSPPSQPQSPVQKDIGLLQELGSEVREDFNFKPSCGTWLMRPPSQPQSPVQKDIGLLQELDSEVRESFNFKPSCGTWLMRPPSQPQSPVQKGIGLLQEPDKVVESAKAKARDALGMMLMEEDTQKAPRKAQASDAVQDALHTLAFEMGVDLNKLSPSEMEAAQGKAQAALAALVQQVMPPAKDVVGDAKAKARSALSSMFSEEKDDVEGAKAKARNALSAVLSEEPMSTSELEEAKNKAKDAFIRAATPQEGLEELAKSKARDALSLLLEDDDEPSVQEIETAKARAKGALAAALQDVSDVEETKARARDALSSALFGDETENMEDVKTKARDALATALFEKNDDDSLTAAKAEARNALAEVLLTPGRDEKDYETAKAKARVSLQAVLLQPTQAEEKADELESAKTNARNAITAAFFGEEDATPTEAAGLENAKASARDAIAAALFPEDSTRSPTEAETLEDAKNSVRSALSGALFGGIPEPTEAQTESQEMQEVKSENERLRKELERLKGQIGEVPAAPCWASGRRLWLPAEPAPAAPALPAARSQAETAELEEAKATARSALFKSARSGSRMGTPSSSPTSRSRQRSGRSTQDLEVIRSAVDIVNCEVQEDALDAHKAKLEATKVEMGSMQTVLRDEVDELDGLLKQLEGERDALRDKQQAASIS
jgi:hypothetical protein